MASSTRWTASTLRSLNELRDHFGFSQQLICGPITKVNLNIDLVLMNNARGIPLLSGSPPDYSGTEASCRKCDKEFNFVFERRRRCNHCGQLPTCSIHESFTSPPQDTLTAPAVRITRHLCLGTLDTIPSQCVHTASNNSIVRPGFETSHNS